MNIPNLPQLDPKLLKTAAFISALSLVAGSWFWLQNRPIPVDPQPLITETTVSPSSIYIHVVGKVINSGVYQLSTGDRVIDAIEAAGGVSENADLTNLNLARILFDGEQILVSGQNDRVETSSTSGKISINQSSASELDSLPGIGPVIASRIVDHRLTNGPFQSLSAIKEVSGIGDALYEKIKDLISL